ncbi:MAG: hypothetical protein QW231_06440 [Candidatus Bathyarchaeia archaeon]
MGHIYAEIEITGAKGFKKIEKVLVDTGASTTILPLTIIEEAGGIKIPTEPVELELGDGRRVKAEVYGVGIKLKGRRAGTLILSFEDAKTVIGVRTLEDLGLKPNPITGELEEERPPGVYYFYNLS